MESDMKSIDHPRPPLTRTHLSESTLTDKSMAPSAMIIDVDYLEDHHHHHHHHHHHLRHSAPMMSTSPSNTAVNPPADLLQALRNIKEPIDSSPSAPHSSTFYSICARNCRHFRYKYRQFFAEFLGTFVMMILINGICAEQTLDVGSSKSWLTSSFGIGLAVLVAISISGHISGGHLNPAVTLTFWMYSGFPRHKVLMYITAQILGCFCGAAVLYTMIRPAIDMFDQGHRQIVGPQATAGIFATYPPLYAGPATAVASEIIGTALLLLLIMVTGHPNNMPFCSMQGVMIAAGLMVICLALGYTSGFSLNPARDLGPRLFTAMAGWGPGVFTVANYYSFIPTFAPIIGGLVGGLIYKLCIDPFDPPSL
ncbi:aquaporin-like protein [Halteromyces radiatus]|uniref:aquaporin-like protein n=1 Tax=Halteromyces radiatus TaxID=101107 RepID=UPI00221EC35F|nr:aquaporin-like protein [Halteromyces radiatus]KAI8088886.1 aquaporin-like protein [Halteromyces radiatus]